jgi:hypothetical protein
MARLLGDVHAFAFYVHWRYRDTGVNFMATVDSVIVHKHFRLDKNKLKRAQEAFGTSTETEAVDRALDFALDEIERNRIVEKAHREFVESGIVIRDVFGRLED